MSAAPSTARKVRANAARIRTPESADPRPASWVGAILALLIAFPSYGAETLKKDVPFTPPADGAFLTDTEASIKLNAFKRVVEERDEYRKALVERPPLQGTVVATLTAFVVGALVGAALVAYAVH